MERRLTIRLSRSPRLSRLQFREPRSIHPLAVHSGDTDAIISIVWRL